MKHTKGPWIADITNVFENFGETDRLHFRVARCDFDGQRNEESKANARLISCAPEMLNALIKSYKELSALWDCLYGQNMSVVGWHLNGDREPLDNFFEDNCQNALEELKSVIEKATGMKIEEVLKNESR